MRRGRTPGKPHGSPCYWCGIKMQSGDAHRAPTRDHVYPKSEYAFDANRVIPVSNYNGAKKSSRNIVWACRSCNHLKGDMRPWDWVCLIDAFDAEGLDWRKLGGLSGPNGKALRLAAIDCGFVFKPPPKFRGSCRHGRGMSCEA